MRPISEDFLAFYLGLNNSLFIIALYSCYKLAQFFTGRLMCYAASV